VFLTLQNIDVILNQKTKLQILWSAWCRPLGGHRL